MAALLLAIAAPAFSAAAAWAAAEPSAATFARMDHAIARRMAANGAPGFAVAVVADNRVVHARGFGAADDSGRRVTAETPFLLGSTTKSFTALAVMQLVDAGKVQLDAPVRRYVPELRLAGDAAERITVRHVLQHTSGLPLNTAGGPILKSSSGPGTPEQAVAELRGKAPVSTPGAKMEYVNANYVLAGLVVERASGEPYGRYVERHIFAPLGMMHSFAAPEPARRAGLAAGHRYVFGFTDTTGPTFRPGVLATGYLMSSAQDMARYLAMHLNDGVAPNGRRVISAQGLRLLLRPGRLATQLGPWADAAKTHYAMGWFVGGPWKEPAVLHPGDAADSSSLMVLLPARKMAVVTLVNASNELAVPGNLAAIPRMERNAVDVLLGAPAKAGASVHRFYFVFDLVVVLLLAGAVVALGRALRDATRPRPPRHRLRAAAGVPGRLVLAALVLGYPPLTGLGWTAALLASGPRARRRRYRHRGARDRRREAGMAPALARRRCACPAHATGGGGSSARARASRSPFMTAGPKRRRKSPQTVAMTSSRPEQRSPSVPPSPVPESPSACYTHRCGASQRRRSAPVGGPRIEGVGLATESAPWFPARGSV